MALAQTGVLAYMVIDRVRLLKSGREITLPIVPVDPRDLFRGEYVRLGYDIGRVPASLLDGPLPGANDAPSTSCWRRRRTARGSPSRCRARMPQRDLARPHRAEGAASAFGRTPWSTPNAMQQVRYGIESYFVPEGQGKRLEDAGAREAAWRR